MVLWMNKAFTAIASVCIVIAITSPIVSYIYFSERLNSTSESYDLQILKLQQENEELREEIIRLSTEPNLVTILGWYLHGSSDPVKDLRNKLTIYGDIYNDGATTAYNCTLIVKFYNNQTLLQTSEIRLGTIKSWFDRQVNTVIDCDCADNVTRIEVEKTWSNSP